MARWQIGVLVTAVVLLAGCGGDSGSSASDDYANDVCSNLGSWVADQEATLKSLRDKGASITGEDLQAALGDVRDSTQVLVENVGELRDSFEDSDECKELGEELENFGSGSS
jgi:hypothetical protein